jgi:hypothetical protein
VTGFLIRFFFWFFPGSGSVPVFGVDRFNDRFGSGNIDSKCQTSGFVHHSSSCFQQQQSKNFATIVMAQSSRAAGRGQKKGRDFPTNVVPPPSFSTGSASVPSIRSGAAATSSEAEKHAFLARQQVQEAKYPFCKLLQIMHMFARLLPWLWKINIHKYFGHLALFIP